MLLAPSVWLIATDLLRRGRHIAAFDASHTWAYAGTGVAGAILWVALLWCAALRRSFFGRVAAGVFAVLFTIVAGVQGGFHSIFNIYCSHDAQIYSRSIPQAVLCHMPLDRPLVILHLLFALFLSIALVVLVQRTLKPGRVARYLAPVLALIALVGVTQVPASYRTLQSSTPDIIYVHGFVSMIKERLRMKDDADELRAQRRTPTPVPEMHAMPARPRNVLFILQESLRHDVVCIDYDPKSDCATPFSNKAAPKRHPFHQLRATASTTAITINNLWTGIGSHESLETLLSVPHLWDYAEAAGYHTAYWTSQNVMFGSMRLYVQDFPVDHYAYATNLDTQAHYDAGALDSLLTDWVIDVWEDVEEPFFGVVHYSNVHFPYVYDPKHAPFQPAVFDRSAGATDEFFNYYKDVVYLSDIAVGRLIDHVRASDKGARTVIVYTSDHG
ncbi:MAG TPA: sulfatase-like hydrolase/transferase, partial [Polyangiaceae bacterium]|nr:sulfatase-like hydrolase/transferase [Polyangiaceae bacterium]